MNSTDGQILGQIPGGSATTGTVLSKPAAHGWKTLTKRGATVAGLLLTCFAAWPAQAAEPVVKAPGYVVTWSAVSPGSVSVTLPGINLPASAVVLLDGKPATTTVSNGRVATITGFIAPWKTGTVQVSIAASPTSPVMMTQYVPVRASAATFDQAARFSTQAAFGPRPDVVLSMQQLGLKGWIAQQLALPAVSYDPTQASRTQFLRMATGGNSLLRLRVAWALQNVFVSQCIFQTFSCIPYERTLERDASGNFRQMMTDVASDASVAMFLNLVGNDVPKNPMQHANQNFARELMQLYTIGPNLLNEDGTAKLDSTGTPIASYTQQDVTEMSRVFTGWAFPPAVDPKYTGYYGFDYSQPLVGYEVKHDQGAKTVLGVSIRANEGIVQDRQVALDTLFAHPNLPPRVAKLLIQHLVKSEPTPGYVARMAKVFENNGRGVRGDMTAVVTAILLDPEAREGDTGSAVDDGFLQEPLLFQTFLTSLTQTTITDDQSSYYPGRLGEDFWYPPSVFGYYRPEYTIPGTTINSPEFQIFNNQSAITRSEYLWGLVTNTEPGYWQSGNSWLASNFKTVPDLLDALDHLAFHGQMPATEKAAILAYCQGLNPHDVKTQLQSAMFLALNSDAYTVSH